MERRVAGLVEKVKQLDGQPSISLQFPPVPVMTWSLMDGQALNIPLRIALQRSFSSCRS